MILRALVYLLLIAMPARAALNYTRILKTSSTEFNVTTSINGMTADAAGNVYLTGSTNSSTFPTTAGSVQPALA